MGLETKQTKSPIRVFDVYVAICVFFHHEIQLIGNFRAIFEHLDADNSGQLDMGEAGSVVSIDNFHCSIATMTVIGARSANVSALCSILAAEAAENHRSGVSSLNAGTGGKTENPFAPPKA